MTVERLGDLAELFESGATTRGCRCMWFASSPDQVRAGWRDGGNRRDFEDDDVWLLPCFFVRAGLFRRRCGG